MIHEIVFSCAGTTRGIADEIAKGLGEEVALHDLLDKSFNETAIVGADDIAVFAVPVWGGRVPAIAVDKLGKIKGAGQRAVAVVVYGNRDYDDALLELCDIVTAQGFNVVSAAAFIAEHCIFPTVATARPDESDHGVIARFINETESLLKSGAFLDMGKIKGNRPYKKYGGVPLRPKTDNDACGNCQVCVTNCPTDAINPETLDTDSGKCISCCRCIAVCKNDARKFTGVAYKTVKFGFEKMCGKRREPELFF